MLHAGFISKACVFKRIVSCVFKWLCIQLNKSTHIHICLGYLPTHCKVYISKFAQISQSSYCHIQCMQLIPRPLVHCCILWLHSLAMECSMDTLHLWSFKRTICNHVGIASVIWPNIYLQITEKSTQLAY